MSIRFIKHICRIILKTQTWHISLSDYMTRQTTSKRLWELRDSNKHYYYEKKMSYLMSIKIFDIFSKTFDFSNFIEINYINSIAQTIRIWRLCGSVHSRTSTKWMREQNLPNARQPANERTCVTAWCSVFQSCKPLSLFIFRVSVISLFCLSESACLPAFLFF